MSTKKIISDDLAKLIDISQIEHTKEECGLHIRMECRYVRCKICGERFGIGIHLESAVGMDFLGQCMRSHNHEFEISVIFRGKVPKEIQELMKE